MNIDVETPDEMLPADRDLVSRIRGRPLDDVDFVVYFRKHSDYEYNMGRPWDGEPIRTGRAVEMIDHPDNWKHTWFLFLRRERAT